MLFPATLVLLGVGLGSLAAWRPRFFRLRTRGVVGSVYKPFAEVTPGVPMYLFA